MSGDFIELGSVRQNGGKIGIAWAFEGDGDPAELVSNTCENGLRAPESGWTFLKSIEAAFRGKEDLTGACSGACFVWTFLRLNATICECENLGK